MLSTTNDLLWRQTHNSTAESFLLFGVVIFLSYLKQWTQISRAASKGNDESSTKGLQSIIFYVYVSLIVSSSAKGSNKTHSNEHVNKVAECTTGKEKRNRLLYLVQTQDFFLF
jgi:hypothetical protein